MQTPLVGELFWAVMDDIGAQRIVLVAGKDWWPEVRGLLDLGDLHAGERPILAAGWSHGRQVGCRLGEEFRGPRVPGKPGSGRA